MIATSAVSAPAPPSSITARGSPRILLIDDEPSLLRMFKTVLGNMGFQSEEARSGPEALARLTKTSFDVVVSDINMPGGTGLEFLRNVREHDLDVPVILMTGKPSLTSSNQALEYGAFRYLIKPVMPATLKEAIDRAVRMHDVARLKRQALELQGGEIKLLGDRASLDARFEKAIAGMWLAFQPIVSWCERRVYGYEALLRSEEPTLATPGAFLDAAERLGKLGELGRAIRTRAAQDAPPDDTRIFVNLHARDLEDDDLYLPEAPLTRLADRVVLEITERASLEGVKDLTSRIGDLRRLGFQIAVDDLGAGYAGLASFAQLDPDIAKLDMSLIRDVDTHATKQTIVRSMQKLCSELGILVVAEGVETTAERDALLASGCDLLQGYLFAKPGRGFPAPRWR
jgi:EAL domain-containing protein (putative c-di-GMP-specific phosphodiesterase class I)